jgi:hypothetical protein
MAGRLCCVIQSTYELGTEATFWDEEDVPVESKAVEVEVDPIEAWAWV